MEFEICNEDWQSFILYEDVMRERIDDVRSALDAGQCVMNVFPNYGFLSVKLPEDLLKIVKDEIEVISKNRNNLSKFNKNLVGQLKYEFPFSDETLKKIEPFIFKLKEVYELNFGNPNKSSFGEIQPDFCLGEMWVNFQSKHEYNPPHIHSGLYSFALWINIPYNLQEEEDMDNGKYSAMPTNSHFYFQYNTTLGEIVQHKIPVDKSMEGHMVFFPAKMSHYVNPFYTSDGERISVSGNLRVNNYAHQK